MARTGWAHWGKRWLYLIHRWLGIVTCLLFAMWFVSGLVMIYVPFPALTAQERLAGLPPIDWQRVAVGPAEAERRASPEGPATGLALEMIGSGPVWRTGTVTLSATDDAPVKPVDAVAAMATASAFARAPAARPERLERDQWTVAGGYNKHRPLWRVRLAGPGARDLYVSGTTGEVVLDTNGRERFWNWLGSVPHWIYPTVLRQYPEAWRQVVIWVSGPCIVIAVTGMWIGILRLRLGRRRFGKGRVTPYRGWMEWHHLAGLLGGVMLTLWIVSGWLSVDPGRLFDSPGIQPQDRAAYAAADRLPAIDAGRLASVAQGARRVEFNWAAGRPLLLVDRPAGQAVIDARTLEPARIDQRQLLAAAARLLPGARIASIERLTAPDLYWYEVGALPRLPVLRVKFDDPAGTWAHIDPATGKLLDDLDRRRRIYRWVYDLFHKWDLNALTLNRPAWDIFLWVFSIAGIVTSVSAIRIGWVRLRGTGKRKKAGT